MITRRPIKGMNMDAFPADLQDGDVRFRLNASKSTDSMLGLGDFNQNGTEEITDVPSKIVGKVQIAERNWIIILSKEDNRDVIGYIDLNEGKYHEIMSAQEFGCDWNFLNCELINVTYDYISGCNELKIYFSSDWTYYHINIDELLDPERKAALKSILKEEGECGTTTCSYFRSFNCVCGVNVTPDKSEHGGYNLMAGVYQFAVRLIDATGSKTNIFKVTEPVLVGSENNIPGERSTEYISLHLTNLDCTYQMVEIIVIKTVSGVIYAESVGTRHYSNGSLTFDYYGTTGREVGIPLQEVMDYGNILLEGQDQFIFNNKMWYYNLKPHRNPNLQERVLKEAKVKIAIHQVPYEDVKKHNYKSLMRGEKYLFGVTYNVCGKGPTPVFVFKPDEDAINTYHPQWNEEETNVTTEGGVTKWQGSSSDLNLESRSSSCGAAQASSCGAADDKQDLTFEALMKKHITDMRTEVTDIARVLDCPPFVCDGQCEGQEEGCDGACISNCDECECDYRRKRAEEVRKTIDTGVDDVCITMTQYITGLAIDTDTPMFSDMTYREAAIDLYTKGVENRWLKAYTARTHTTNTKEYPVTKATIEQGSDIYGNTILSSGVQFKGNIPFKIKEANYTYPDTLDCEGKLIYGEFANQPVQLFEVPSAAEIPIVFSESAGVISEHEARPEWNNALVNLVGIEVENIPIPTEEELGGVLCEDDPFTIVMVERTMINSSVVAKGIIHSTFVGDVNGKTYAFPRHAVNSKEIIDRFVSDKVKKDVNGRPSRIGTNPSIDKNFIFHSLDTAVYHMGLAVDELHPELMVFGIGSRYGMYSKGIEPENSIYGRRTDRRGTRSGIHLHQSLPTENSPKEIYGITYAAPNNVVTPPKEGILPLMNRYREGSVYLQVNSPLRMDTDFSFVGDTLQHTVEGLTGFTEYVSLRRNIPDQYGGLVNQSYVSTGLSGNRNSILYKKVRGIIGDTFVGYTTVRRTSYISDKVGSKFNIPSTAYYSGGGLFGTTDANRSVCDHPVAGLAEGFYVKTSLPEDGDIGDPKNWAGLHTIVGSGPLTFAEAKLDSEFPRTEYYYPRTLTHLNHYWGEFRVCPWLLQTGPGEQKLIQDIYYPKLKDAGFDSSLDGSPYKECFMEKFGFEVQQPSKAQVLKKVLLKSLLTYLLPAAGITALAFVEEGVGTAVYAAAIPLLTALNEYLRLNAFSDEKIDELLGIPTCKTDPEGSQEDHAVVGFKDNYTEYNTDYSSPNRVSSFFGLSDPYYTCNCDDVVNGSTSNEIKFSSIRMEGSPMDAYIRVSPWDSVFVPSKMGELRKLFTESGRFYAHTNKFILTLQEGKTSIPTVDGKELIVGGGTMLEIPDSLYEGVPEGFLGIEDPNASIVTPYGYVFANRTGIYMIGGRTSTILNQGLNRFLIEKLPINCVGCRDQLNGLDYMFGMDYKNSMLYFTKKDCECSFTIGYDLGSKSWYSFYSFIPDMYLWSDANMYSIKNSKLWKHGSGIPQTYYNTLYSHIIEIPFSNGPIEFKSLLLDTIAFEENKMDATRTFDQIAMYTMSQSSGEKIMKVRTDKENLNSLIKEDSFARAEFDGRMFKINNITNKASWGDQILDTTCPLPLILPPQGVGHYQERFFDDYIMLRLTNNEPKTLMTRAAIMHVDQRADG